MNTLWHALLWAIVILKHVQFSGISSDLLQQVPYRIIHGVTDASGMLM